MKQEKSTTGLEESNAGDHDDNFVVITELVSPLQRQLLEQKILLANTPADTQDQACLAREVRKLRLLERLAQAEQVRNPHYAVTRLLDLEEKAEVEAEDNQPNRPSGLADHLVHLCGLGDLRGDLDEERQDMAALSGERAANRWFYRQILVSISPMMPKMICSLVKKWAVVIAGKVASDAFARWVEEVIRRIAH